jgi:hypothetical protein
MRGYRTYKREGKLFRDHKEKIRQAALEAIRLQKRTTAQVLIAYHWRKYWAKVFLQLMKEKSQTKKGLDFEKMSVLEMQIHMQEKRKKKQEREDKRKRKARAKKQAAAGAKNNAGRVGGGFGAKNNAYGVGA